MKNEKSTICTTPEELANSIALDSDDAITWRDKYIDELKAELLKSQHDYRLLLGANKDIRIRCDELLSDNTAHSLKINELQKQSEALEAKLKDAQWDYEGALADCDYYKDRVVELKREVERLESKQCPMFDAHYKKCEVENGQMKEELEAANEVVKDLAKMMNEAIAERDELKTSVEMLRTEEQEMCNYAQKLKDERDYLKEVIEKTLSASGPVQQVVPSIQLREALSNVSDRPSRRFKLMVETLNILRHIRDNPEQTPENSSRAGALVEKLEKEFK